MRWYRTKEKIALGATLLFGALALMLVIGSLLGFLVMWLWNWLMPEILGLPEITYWQAWGLFFLAQLLFTRSSNASSKSD